MQAKNVPYHKKQPAAKDLFGNEPRKTHYKTMPDTELTLDCEYTYRPSTPITLQPPSPTLSHPSKDPHFPNIEQNDFQILDCKKINDLLSVAFCAVRRGSSSRLWVFVSVLLPVLLSVYSLNRIWVLRMTGFY